MHWLDPLVFAGVYVMVSVYSAAVLILVQGIRIPMLTAAEKAKGGRPMSQIVRQPALIVALTSSMFGYGVMTLIMSATPLAMQACGFAFNDSATVIQGHIIAMFLPSFFTGHLIARFGVLSVIATGAVIEILCALVNLSGIEFWNFFVQSARRPRWNFTFVGGTTLLTTTYMPSERAKVQGSHDFASTARRRRPRALRHPPGERRLDRRQHGRPTVDGDRAARRTWLSRVQSRRLSPSAEPAWLNQITPLVSVCGGRAQDAKPDFRQHLLQRVRHAEHERVRSVRADDLIRTACRHGPPRRG